MTKLDLSVRFIGDGIQVSSGIELETPTASIEWLSKDTMSVVSVIVDGTKTTSIEQSDAGTVFLPDCIKYRFKRDSPFSEIQVDLQGRVSGWMDKLTPDFRYLSMYSAWYPVYQDIEIGEVHIVIHDCEEFDVLKARYDSRTRDWYYGGNGFAPYDVIAFRKECYSVTRNEVANVYFVDPSEQAAAEVIANAMRDSLRFFSGGLFEKRDMGAYDVVSAGGTVEFAGYTRKELIVYDKLPTIPKDTEMCVAHEIAHAWCSGAEPTTYEDWLNETTAEWAAILFGLSTGVGEDYILGPTMERYEKWAKDKPPIISDGTTRSIGGAQRGILMFGEIFKQHGSSKIEELISLFVSLEEKNTERYLEELQRTDPSTAEKIHRWLYAEELPSAIAS